MLDTQFKHIPEKEKKFMREWGKTRKMGRLKYTLVYGFLSGVIGFLVLSIGNGFALSNLIQATLGGMILCGMYTWTVNERSYLKTLKNVEQVTAEKDDKKTKIPLSFSEKRKLSLSQNKEKVSIKNEMFFKNK